MLEVGRIAKSHGLRGEVIVELFTNRPERVQSGAVLSAPGHNLVVQRGSAHQHRWIVKFLGVETREAADELRGLTLSADPLEDPDALWVHELVGAEVLLKDGDKLSTVKSVLANPAGDLLELADKTLVPLVFVIEHGPGFVRIDPPAGLIELNKD